MSNKLKLVKGGPPRGTLVYGMRMLELGQAADVGRAAVRLADGTTAYVTMHLIEGSRAHIRKQLMESIDAFFELIDEAP